MGRPASRDAISCVSTRRAPLRRKIFIQALTQARMPRGGRYETKEPKKMFHLPYRLLRAAVERGVAGAEGGGRAAVRDLVSGGTRPVRSRRSRFAYDLDRRFARASDADQRRPEDSADFRD